MCGNTGNNEQIQIGQLFSRDLHDLTDRLVFVGHRWVVVADKHTTNFRALALASDFICLKVGYYTKETYLSEYYQGKKYPMSFFKAQFPTFKFIQWSRLDKQTGKVTFVSYVIT